MDISRYISELLFEHECVIIPGFGGLICSYKPANIHPVQHIFYPPSKSLLFNPQLKTNDGLLANQISVGQKVNYNQALEIIDEFVGDTLTTINNGGQISLENIGVIYADQEGNLQFKQDIKNNFLKESYGLSSFISPKISRNYSKIIRKSEPQFTDRKRKPNRRKQVVLTNLALLIIPVLLTFGYFYFNLGVFESGYQNKTSLVPDLSGKTESLQMPSQQISNADILDAQKLEAISFWIPQNTPSQNIWQQPVLAKKSIEKPEVLSESSPSTKLNEPAVTVENLPPPAVSSGKMFYLIGGSFENIENADKLIAQYSGKGYNPQIIGQASNGYYRVSLQDFIRKEEAMAELRKIRETEIPGAWVLRQ